MGLGGYVGLLFVVACRLWWLVMLIVLFIYFLLCVRIFMFWFVFYCCLLRMFKSVYVVAAHCLVVLGLSGCCSCLVVGRFVVVGFVCRLVMRVVLFGVYVFVVCGSNWLLSVVFCLVEGLFAVYMCSGCLVVWFRCRYVSCWFGCVCLVCDGATGC